LVRCSRIHLFQSRITDQIQNLLRQALYFNFDYYNAKGEGAFMNKPHIVQKHVSKYYTSWSTHDYPPSHTD